MALRSGWIAEQSVMRQAISVLGLLILLSGCKTIAEVERQEAIDREVADAATCARLGAPPGTERDFQCKLALETQRRNEYATYGAIQSAQQQAQTQNYANSLMFGR